MLIVDFFLATSIPYMVLWLLWTHIYSTHGYEQMGGFTYVQTMFYYAYAIAIGRLNNGYDVLHSLSKDIVSGRLEIYLVFPAALPLQRLFDFLGASFLYLLPVITIYCAQTFFFMPTLGFLNLIEFVLFLILIIFSQILCFILSFLLGLLAFWFYKDEALLFLLTLFSGFLGGIYLPPDFWPKALQPLMMYNPFRFIISAPAEFLITRDMSLFLHSIVFSIAYIFLFLILGNIVWRLGKNRYTSAGG